jgi:Amt family ammonium transporter
MNECCRLSGAIILGPRIDRFKDKDSMYISGHSIPHISLGGFILIFGFMAFNAGSQGTMSQKGDGEAIAAACLSTLVSTEAKFK